MPARTFWMVEKEEAHKLGMEVRGGKGFEESWMGRVQEGWDKHPQDWLAACENGRKLILTQLKYTAALGERILTSW